MKRHFLFLAATAWLHAEVPQVTWQMISSSHSGCEGAQWIGETLYYAAHHDGYTFSWTADAGLKILRKDSPEATSFRPDGQGGFFVVEQTTRQLARWNQQHERVEVLADRFDGRRFNRPNDCAVHPDGSIWFTDPDWLFKARPQDIKEQPGQYVFRFDPKTKVISKVADGFDKPNGIVFTTDGGFLYLTDAMKPEVLRYKVEPDGTLTERQVWATFTEAGLDGLALRSNGDLWCCTADGVRIVDSSAQPLGLLKVPGRPTSISFSPSGMVCVTLRNACVVGKLTPASAALPRSN
jgi:gluconolactonase